MTAHMPLYYTLVRIQTLLWVDYNIHQAGQNFRIEGDWPGEVMGKQKDGKQKENHLYKPGDVLPDHKDRSACEISATVTLGIRHIGKSDNYRWCLHSYVNGEKRYLECNVGDAVIYKGCEIEHGRDKFDVDEYSYQVQCFLHYVNVNGPTYTEELKYDRRPSIGFKVKETIVNNGRPEIGC